MVSPASAATRIQRKWREVQKYRNPFNKIDYPVISKIALSLSPQSRRAFMTAIRPPTNINRYVSKNITAKKVKQSKLQSSLMSASRVGRVPPNHPNRLIKTLKGLVTIRKMLDRYVFIREFPVQMKVANQKKYINKQIKIVSRYLLAPNSNFGNTKLPKNIQYAINHNTANAPEMLQIWINTPIHQRRYFKYYANNIGRNNWDHGFPINEWYHRYIMNNERRLNL